MGREVVSDEMGGVTNGKVLAFSGVEAQLPIFGPASAEETFDPARSIVLKRYQEGDVS